MDRTCRFVWKVANHFFQGSICLKRYAPRLFPFASSIREASFILRIRTGKALLRAIVLIQRENMRRSFWLEAQSFEQMHEGLFSFFKDCFRLVEGLFFLRRDAFFNGYAVIQIEKRHDMLVQAGASPSV